MTTSGWVKDLTLEIKGCAVTSILIHEVLAKRKASMDQLRKGLESLRVLSLLNNNPDLMQEYFVKREKELTPDMLISQVFENTTVCQTVEENEKARGFFLKTLVELHKSNNKQYTIFPLRDFHYIFPLHNYVDIITKSIKTYLKYTLTCFNISNGIFYTCFLDQKSNGMQKALMYMTALDSIPPLGMSEKVELLFREDDSKSLSAEAYLFKLKIPTVHNDFESFYQAFMIAIQFGCNGFRTA